VSVTRAARVGVLGSVNVDVVVRCADFPRPGETILASNPVRLPGGKAANQAAALARLGVDTTLLARVGGDDLGDWSLRNAHAHGVHTIDVQRGPEPTGSAYIMVDASGENIIVVSPGANASLDVNAFALESFDVILAQMEVSPEVVAAAAARASSLILNVAPARSVDPAILDRCRVVIANELESEQFDLASLAHCVVTFGAAGAVHYAYGREVCRATPPAVTVVDTVGAGDVFCAAYTAQFVRGVSDQEALDFAVTAGALATQASGAQGALPTYQEIQTWLARE